jgi:hypothetical protein
MTQNRTPRQGGVGHFSRTFRLHTAGQRRTFFGNVG